MAFFGFLKGIQDAVLTAAKLGKKKPPTGEGSLPVQMSQTGSILDAPPTNSAGEPWPTTPPPPTVVNVMDEEARKKSTIPEAKVAGLQKRNKLESDVKNKALKLVQEEWGRKYGLKKGEKLAFGGEDEETFTTPIYQQGIGGISRAARGALTRLGVPITPPIQSKLVELEEMESLGLRAQEASPSIPYAPGSGKLESATQTVKEMDEALKYVVTPEQKARLEQQRALAMRTLDPEGKAEQAKQEASLSQPPSQSITGAAKAAGVPEADFNDAIDEVAKKLGLNLDEEVDFPLALQRLLNSAEFAEVRPDFEALGASSQMGPPASAAPGFEGGEKGKEAGQAPVDLHAEERNLLAKISATKDINTWYEAIAFVLLSMLIKPQMAILFFSRASERGQLKADLVQNRQKQKIRGEEKKAAADRAEWTRRQAVEATIRHAEKKDESRQKFVRDWFLLRQRSVLFKKAPKDDIAAQMQKDFDNWSNMAAKAGQSMQYDRAEIYMDKADELLKRMEEYSAQKTGAVAP